MEEEEDLSHALSNLKHGTRMVIPKFIDDVDGGEGDNVVQCGYIALCMKVELVFICVGHCCCLLLKLCCCYFYGGWERSNICVNHFELISSCIICVCEFGDCALCFHTYFFLF